MPSITQALATINKLAEKNIGSVGFSTNNIEDVFLIEDYTISKEGVNYTVINLATGKRETRLHQYVEILPDTQVYHNLQTGEYHVSKHEVNTIDCFQMGYGAVSIDSPDGKHSYSLTADSPGIHFTPQGRSTIETITAKEARQQALMLLHAADLAEGKTSI